MIHHRIKHLFGIVTLMLLLPLAPAQHAQAALAPTLVKDINPGAVSSFPGDFVAMNDTLFFTADDGVHGRGLWKSDGTTAGTALLKSGGNPKSLAVVGNTFYFATNDYPSYNLWKSDGTSAGTSRVADVAVEYFAIKSSVAFQGKLFFAARSKDPDNPISPLWSSDGTATGTVPITFAGFEQQQQQRIVDMVVAGDTLYYTTYDERLNANRESITGPALYRSDGTVAGTQKLLQIDAGTAEIHKMIFNGDKLFFSVFDRTSRTPGGLWTSDGTVTGTAPLADATGQLVGQSYGLFDFNGLIVFGGGPTGFYKDSELWRSDGTPAGTYRIKDIKPGPESSSPNSFTVFNNLLYFTAGDNFENETEAGTFGAEMWRSDGTEAGTFRVTDISPGPNSSRPYGFVVFNSALYFAADAEGNYGYTFWRSDGTATGTTQLIAPTTRQPLESDRSQSPINVGNTALFFSTNDSRSGYELWKLAEVGNRVRTGLQALYDFNEGSGSVVRDTSGVGNPLDLTVKKSSQVRWNSGSLEVTGFTPIASTGPATKLIDAARASDAVTVEAWVTPADIKQYSARILTISPNATVRNLTLTQGVFNQNDSTIASLRLRTTTTANSGQALFSPTGSIQPALTHLVATIAADGTVRMYVNGAQVAQAQASGTFDNWNTTYPLILAGELPSGRSWRGTYHLVALYDRALNAAEVEQNYAAGPEAP